MHCDHPACVSACIVGAFTKQDNGSVIWDTSKCIGCRYCMVACPFQVPTFEYDKAIEPKISKCDFCFERTKNRKTSGLLSRFARLKLLFNAPRSELIKIARDKIKRYPGKIHHPHLRRKRKSAVLAGYTLQAESLPKSVSRICMIKQPRVFPNQFSMASLLILCPRFYSIQFLGVIMWASKRKSETEAEVVNHGGDNE